MSVKITIPNTSSDYLTFGSANTPDAAKIGGYEDSTGNGHLELYTTASGTSTERMRIDANGNVGVGTTPPSTMIASSGLSVGANGIIHTPTSNQFSVADNAYWTGTLWKAKATQNGYAAIRYNAAGDGTVSIHSNSSAFTAGDTLTQMDGTDGNFVFFADGSLRLNKTTGTITNNAGRKILGQTGSVLQVVQGTYSTQVTSSSGTYIDTGLTATITPSSTSSKILVIVQQAGCGKINDVTLQLQLLRDSTALFEFESSGGWTATTTRNYIGTCGCSYLDSPATSSAVTYKTQMSAYSAGASVYTQYNVGSGNPTSTITLLEIAG